MSTKIKDLVDVTPVGARAASQQGTDAGRLSSFLLSYELGDAISRTVERLVSSEDGAHNALIVGGPGCGKSHLLDAIAALLEVDPKVPLHPRLAEIKGEIASRKLLVVRLADDDPERRLAAAIERATLEHLAAVRTVVPPTIEGQGSRIDAIARAVSSLPDRHRVVYFIDNLDRWLDAATRYAIENAHALVRLGELSRDIELSVCAAAGEYVLSHDSSAGGQGWIAAMLDTYRIEYVPSRALRAAAASNILVKSSRQRREILQVLRLLRTKLPDLECSDEEFAEFYPLESSTWTVGSHLHRWIPNFSFPEFTERAAESVKRRPAPSLFALNDMFTLYEPQLRGVETLASSFTAYDHLVADALPRLGQSQRLWGRLALQSIFMHSLAGIAADVKTIANSVLLYDLHGGRSSYEMMLAVLKQMETLDEGQLVATGEGEARRYSLVTGEREALMVRIEEMIEEIAPEEAAAALLAAGSGFFADWPFATSAGERGRVDLWDIEQSEGWAAIEVRPIDEILSAAERPRLMLFHPGTPWFEANEHARKRAATACWIASMPTPAERDALRRWLAATRLAKTARGRRYADIPVVLADLDAQAATIFERLYIENGLRVTAERSDTIADLVGPSREENFVVRLLPRRPAEAAAAASGGENTWVAHLLADSRDEVDAMHTESDGLGLMQRLEVWYGTRVSRDDTGPLETLGARGGEIGEITAALDAKQLFDAALHYTRRALAAGSLEGLGGSLAKIFESPERLWEARERLAWLDRFAEWLPSLERMTRYLGAAEAVEDGDVEELRASLVSWAGRLDEFVNERRRKAFDDTFEAFREEYVRIYLRLHDGTVGAETIDRQAAEIVSSESWAALETLSALSIGTHSFLVDAINLISVLRDTQCSANAGATLEREPVCSCGFRFSDRERIGAITSSALEFVATGIDYHRRLLQSRRMELRDKLIAGKSSFPFDTIRAIADLTKDAPLVTPIEPRTVEAINALLTPGDDWVGDTDDPAVATRAKGI
jgi:hypothetical protein